MRQQPQPPPALLLPQGIPSLRDIKGREWTPQLRMRRKAPARWRCTRQRKPALPKRASQPAASPHRVPLQLSTVPPHRKRQSRTKPLPGKRSGYQRQPTESKRPSRRRPAKPLTVALQKAPSPPETLVHRAPVPPPSACLRRKAPLLARPPSAKRRRHRRQQTRHKAADRLAPPLAWPRQASPSAPPMLPATSQRRTQ